MAVSTKKKKRKEFKLLVSESDLLWNYYLVNMMAAIMLHYERISISILNLKFPIYCTYHKSHLYRFTYVQYYKILHTCTVHLPNHYKVLITSLLLLRLLCFLPSASGEEDIFVIYSVKETINWLQSLKFLSDIPPHQAKRRDLQHQQYYLNIYCRNWILIITVLSLHLSSNNNKLIHVILQSHSTFLAS